MDAKSMLVYLREHGYVCHQVQPDSAGNLTVFTDADQSGPARQAVERLPAVIRTRASAPGIFRVIYNPVATDPADLANDGHT